MLRRLPGLFLVLLISFGFAPRATYANGQALPPLPSQAVINSVLSQTNGAQFTPLYAPTIIMTQLAGFTGVFQNVHTQLDTSQAVNYLTAGGSRLFETVIPMLNSGAIVLDPDMTAPGADPRPGKIIGALFQPSGGTFYVVAVFKPEAASCPGCEPPEKVRFYYNADQYYEAQIYWGQFLDPNGDGQLEFVDQGAIIADKYSCVSVGLEQICWDAYNYSQGREQVVPKDTVHSASKSFKKVYDFQVSFNVKDAVPDLIGGIDRTACSAQIVTATTYDNLMACTPNLMFTASKEVMPNQPIAIFVVTRPADIRTYDKNGNFIGALPRGRYLVMDATPNVTMPGQPALLFLVNMDTVNHYLIPSVAVQGFSPTSAIPDKRAAAIKDGLAGYRGIGR